jgi:hypothetical protein
MYVQGVDRVFDLNFNGRDGERKVTYGDVFLQAEKEYSRHNFEYAETDMLFEQFKMAEAACRKYIDAGWVTEGNSKRHLMALPAYDQCIKASHVFNLLDARGVISVTERQSYILRVRELAKACGEAWLATEAGGAAYRDASAFDAAIVRQEQQMEQASVGSEERARSTAQTGSPHNAEKIRKIANQALDDALHILALIELLRKQSADGVDARLSQAGASNAATGARNAMIGYLVLLISRAYAKPREGDLHLRVAADLLRSDKMAREIFDSANRPKKVADFEEHWAKCLGDHRRERIEHFRDKHTAHLGEPKKIPEPEYRELFGFGEATVEAIELLALVTGVAVKSIKDNNDAVQSAEAYWRPWIGD